VSVRKSLAWSFSQEFLQKTVGFFGSIAIARLLTPNEVGIFSLAMAASFLMNALRDFGVSTYIVREPGLTHAKIRTVFGLTLAIQGGLGLIVLVVSVPLANLYQEPGIGRVLLVIALTFFISPFGQPAYALLRRDMRFDVLHHIEVAAAMIGTVTSVGLAALGHGFMALAWGYMIRTVLRAMLPLAVRRDHLRLRPSLRHWREVLRFGGWLTAGGFAGSVVSEGNRLMIGGFLAPSALALFERAQQLPRISREFLFYSVGRVIVPKFSQNIRDGIAIGDSVDMYISATTVILWPAYMGMCFLSIPIILLLFGETWLVAGEILPYILIGTIIRAGLPQPEEILVPHGLVRRLFVFRCFHVVNALTFTVIGCLHSIELFAMLRIPASILYVTANFIGIFPYMDVPVRQMFYRYAQSFGIGAVCAIPSVSAYLVHGVAVPPHHLAVVIAVSAVLWFALLHLTRHPLAAELGGILRAARTRLGWR
jgi:O-antigen/teichoic acid export membrane protein